MIEVDSSERGESALRVSDSQKFVESMIVKTRTSRTIVYKKNSSKIEVVSCFSKEEKQLQRAEMQATELLKSLILDTSMLTSEIEGGGRKQMR